MGNLYNKSDDLLIKDIYILKDNIIKDPIPIDKRESDEIYKKLIIINQLQI